MLKKICLAGFIIIAGFSCSSTIPPVCYQATRARLDAQHATGEQKAMLESKAAGLEQACERERNLNYEQFKSMQKRNLK